MHLGCDKGVLGRTWHNLFDYFDFENSISAFVNPGGHCIAQDIL